MKTTYQKMCKYGISTLVFGKARKKNLGLYWMMIGFLFALGFISRFL